MFCFIHCLFYSTLPHLLSASLACSPLMVGMDAALLKRILGALADGLNRGLTSALPKR